MERAGVWGFWFESSEGSGLETSETKGEGSWKSGSGW
jgi:hypothetical protein